MGQTLTHGVYLPDEGERNCYSGLAANWQILDTSVGTIAAHTAALAGKAPLVHTHTKSDITDFPAYGTTAGTICEGNDARLSDARTPVAHTHTKSDVTDLLNSNFIPSANNSYDLGSSSYQWNNVYANTVNAANAVYTNTALVHDVRATGTSNALILAAMETWEDGARIFMYGKDNVNGATIYADIDHNDGIHSKTGVTLNINGFYPSGVSRHLGLADANNRWLTFNGINPGALSIFNPSASYDPIDIPTSWDTSGASWNALSVSNLGDGWVCITYNNCSAGDYILVRFGGTSGTRYPSLKFEAVKGADNKYYIYALFPVAKAFSNIYLEMLINSNANLILHHYIPAYGTV